MNKDKKIMFSVEITESLKDKLRDYAYIHKLTLSAAVRKIIESYLEEQYNEFTTTERMKSE